MKRLLSALIFICITSTAFAQNKLDIIFDGETNVELIEAIGREFRALDNVEIVTDVNEALIVVSMNHKTIEKHLIVSIVVMYNNEDGQLVHLAHDLRIRDNAQDLSADLAEYVRLKVLINLD